ncbi:MAG: GIY-YIG nuclease family protein [Candidatus Magasanikbacteria bacterium]|nr:GIY-YIG nuclease family protein [Candidatus Magasanikbacteria bacterium]
MEKQYFTYIARCGDQSLYTGSTDSLIKREEKHNNGTGSIYTKTHLPVKIIYSESFSTRKEAVKREMQIKGWVKTKKENLIRFGHPNPTKILRQKPKREYENLAQKKT